VVSKDLVAAKLAELAERVARVQSKCPRAAAELGADADALDIVSFNLMLAVQLCADIASHIIADEEWLPAKSIAESFGRIEEHRVIGTETADSLRRAVGLRNVVAHGYGHVDAGMVFGAATAGLRDLDRFAREVAVWVRTRPT
jgi:uncharacterized protein YutE (UPF0331/DUF86 family)